MITSGPGACELDCRFWYLRVTLRQRVLYDKVSAFDETLFVQPFPETPDVSGRWWPDAEKADTARRHLLGGYWVRNQRGTEEHKEITPLHLRQPQ